MIKDYDNKIFEGVYEANERFGIAFLTTKIISSVCGVSEGSFYRHFESKDDLLLKAYNSIDKEIAEVLQKIELPKVKSTFLIPKKTIAKVVKEKLWDPYFSYFLNNPRKALFYIQYSEMYGDNVDQWIKDGQTVKDYYSGFFSSMNYLDSIGGIFKKINAQVYYTYILDTTMNFAKKIIQGKIEDTKENRQAIFNIMFNGLMNL
jgi:AcrR family transcriptional regulator